MINKKWDEVLKDEMKKVIKIERSCRR